MEETTQFGTELNDALFNHDERLALQLIKEGANTNGRHLENGSSAIHFACEAGLYGIVAVLLGRGVDPDTTNAWGFTPLEYTRKFPNVRVILEEHGGSGYGSKLSEAIVARDEKLALELIQNGADISVPYKPNGSLAIHFAAKSGFTSILEALLLQTEDVNVTNRFGLTPLWFAVQANSTACAALLVAHGGIAYGCALNDALDARNEAQALQILRTCTDEEVPSPPNGLTPLHYAARGNMIDAATELLERGANVNVLSRLGETPLTLTGDAPAMQRLLASHGGWRYGSLLNDALEAGNENEAIRLLGIPSTDIRAVCPMNGSNALHFAASSGCVTALAILLRRGLDARASLNRYGHGPGFFAASNEVVTLLAEYLAPEEQNTQSLGSGQTAAVLQEDWVLV